MRVSFPVTHGSPVLIGKPARAAEEDFVQLILRVLALASLKIETHLPQVFVVGVSEVPCLTLVIVVPEGQNQEALQDKLQEAISRETAIQTLNAWFLPPSHDLLPMVRQAGCRLT